MPAKPKEDWSIYFNKLNKTLNNFEQRIEMLEKQVIVLSKKQQQARFETKAGAITSTELSYESPPKRRLGWALIWISIAVYILPWFGFFNFGYGYGSSIFYNLRNLVALGLFIGGIVLILTNPKQGKAVEVKQKKDYDLDEESLLMPEEKVPAKKVTAKVQTAKELPKSKETKTDLETAIGKKWLPKIGIVSIVLGVAFFVIWVIANGYIGPTAQVALGVLAGIAVIVTGEAFYRREYKNYGLTLVGGGFAIIYFAMFAAYRFYGKGIGIPFSADITALSFIIVAAVYFSIRYNSTVIAGEAFFLGYLVPLLTSSVNTFFLVYAIALTAGLTILVYYKSWNYLGAGGMAAMYITHMFWLDYYKESNKDLLHLLFLFIYFVMFAFMAIRIKQGPKEEPSSWINSKSLFAALFIVTFLFLFQLDFSNPFIVSAPLVLLVLLLSYFVIKFQWDHFSIGGILMTYFVHWKWLGMNFKESSLTINFIELTIYFLLFNILLFLLYKEKNKAANVIGILLNSLLYYGLNLWPGYYFNHGYGGLFSAGLAVFFFIMAYISYSKKISHYFNTYILLCFGYLTLAIPLQFNREWVTISWAALTLILVILSFRLKENSIRIASSIVGAVTFARVLFYDSWKLHSFDTSNFLNSTRLFAFGATIIIFYIISYLYYKHKDDFDDYETYIIYINAIYVIAATLLTTVLIWLEIWDTQLLPNAKNLSTSLAIILQAIIILALGFSAKIKLFRVLGLILLGLAIVKVFLFDLSSLETGYRIISFIVLGVIALTGAFLYNKYKVYI